MFQQSVQQSKVIVKGTMAKFQGVLTLFQAVLAQVANEPLPDWEQLGQEAEVARRRQQPWGKVTWKQQSILWFRWSVGKGDNYDVWEIPGGLSLYRHPNWIQRIAQAISDFFATMLFAPIYALKNWLESISLQLASQLGWLFLILSIPLAIIAFLLDIVFLFLKFLILVPMLFFAPSFFLMRLLALPFQLVGAFFWRLIWALFLPWFVKTLTAVTAQTLKLFPWLKGIVLGILRMGQPRYPVLIPKETVSQVLIVEKGWFRKRKYLVIVEGEPLKQFGIFAGLISWVKHRLPFYWERSVHMVGMPRKGADELIQSICAVLEKSQSNLKTQVRPPSAFQWQNEQAYQSYLQGNLALKAVRGARSKDERIQYYHQAARAYEKAIELEPDHEDSRLYAVLGHCCYEIARATPPLQQQDWLFKAKITLNRALELNATHHNLGEDLLHQVRKYAGIVESRLEPTAQVRPPSVSQWQSEQAHKFHLQGNSALKAARGGSSKDERIRYYHQAAPAYEKAIGLAPNYEESRLYVTLGHCCYEIARATPPLQQKDWLFKAKIALNHALELNAVHPELDEVLLLQAQKFLLITENGYGDKHGERRPIT
jgi:tetratricopeptide (TPR) repeat protein